VAIYNLAWGVVVVPLLGVLSSFLAETQRRAAQICFAGSVLAFILAAVVLGVRVTHAPTAAFNNVLTFFAMNPPESSLFANRLEPMLGVYVDALSAAFGAAVSFGVVVVQGYALTSLRGEQRYRRFFWASSALAFASAGFVFSPSLFQALFMWAGGSAAIYLLVAHWWDRPDLAAPARRVMVVLAAANASLFLATAFAFSKFGQFAATLPAPTGQDINDPFSFITLARAAAATGIGLVQGAGMRTLVVLGVVLIVAAVIRAGQFPFHVWVTEAAVAPTPAIALVAGIGALPALLLLARVYPVIALAPHLALVIALSGAVTAVFASITAVAQRDLLRIGLFTALTQGGLALTALGSGGFSAATFIAFTSVFFTTLFFLVAGNVVRVYRTRNIHETGGAWSRMRATSVGLVIWAAGTAGLALSGYYAVSSLFTNRSPLGGHLGDAGRGLTVALVLISGVTVSLAAWRVVAAVCAGEVTKRRGFQAERVGDVERSLRSPMILATVAAVASVLVGLPGLQPIHSGKLSVPGLTFTHFVFFGPRRQTLSLDVLALVLALGAAALGAAAGWYAFAAQRRARTAALVSRNEAAARVIARGLFLERVAHRAGHPVLVAAQAAERVDVSVAPQLVDAAAAGTTLAAASLSRLRLVKLNAHLSLGVLAAGVLALLGLLAATGHFWIHTL
jgi:NADH:ubiquinone oxidoreductase subunit 5 (subunit L)/multisubunit Na+/H+ antiporter MnhA subunit